MNQNNYLRNIIKEETKSIRLESLLENCEKLKQDILNDRKKILAEAVTAMSRHKKLKKPFSIQPQERYKYQISNRWINGPWGENEKAEKLLYTFGAGSFALGNREHGIELDVKVKEVYYQEYWDEETKEVKTRKSEDKKPQMKAHDRLWFFVDGTVYSSMTLRTLGYDEAKDAAGKPVIRLWNSRRGNVQPEDRYFWENDDIAGQIDLLTPTGPAILTTKAPTGDKIEAPTNEVLDWIQLIMDFAGIIPGIGDIIDIINAMISFYRAKYRGEEGKWLEGMLSLAAAIPFIGSTIGIAGKSLKKGVGSISVGGKSFNKAWDNFIFGKVGDPKAADRAMKEFIKAGYLTEKQIARMVTGDEFGKIAKLMRKKSKQINGLFPGSKQIVAEFDKFAKNAEEANKALKEIYKISKQGDSVEYNRLFKKVSPGRQKQLQKRIAQRGEKTAGKTGGFISKVGHTLTVKQFNRLKRISGYPAKQSQRIARLMTDGFSKKIMKDPNKLAAVGMIEIQGKLGTQLGKNVDDFMVIVNNNRVYKEELEKILNKRHFSNLEDLNVQFKGKYNISSKLTDGKTWSSKNLTAKEMSSFFDAIRDKRLRSIGNESTNLAADELYRKMSTGISESAIENNNLFFNLHKADLSNNFKAMINPGFQWNRYDGLGTNVGGLIRNMDGSTRKWLDVLYNEATDLSEEMGWEARDDVNGVVLPLMKAAIWDNIPGDSKDGVKKILTSAKKIATATGQSVVDVVNTMANTIGVPSPIGADYGDTLATKMKAYGKAADTYD